MSFRYPSRALLTFVLLFGWLPQGQAAITLLSKGESVFGRPLYASAGATANSVSILGAIDPLNRYSWGASAQSRIQLTSPTGSVNLKFIWYRSQSTFFNIPGLTSPSNSGVFAPYLQANGQTYTIDLYTTASPESAAGAIIWGEVEVGIPGEDEESSFKDWVDFGEVDEEEGNMEEPTPSGGYQLATFPTVGSYGFTDYFYASVEPHELPVTEATPLYFNSTNPITSLLVPGEAGGGSYLVRVGEITQTVNSGQSIDLSALSPGGVDHFLIWPASEAVRPLTGTDPLTVLGFRFAAPGVTTLGQAQIVPVPEPGTLTLAGSALAAVAFASRRTRHQRKSGQ
jgi:hypothetical protein